MRKRDNYKKEVFTVSIDVIGIIMSRSQNVLFCPIFASGSNFNPRNTQCIQRVKAFAFLDLGTGSNILKLTLILFFIFGILLFPHGVFAEKKENPESVYVGMEKCRKCHPKHVKSYSAWKYSRNFRILQMRGKDHDHRCLPCHTTGYGKPGGFRSVESTPHMKNIQCESCHGPASLHVAKPTDKKNQQKLGVPQNICIACHRPHRHMRY